MLETLRSYLDKEELKYVAVSHSPAFTAQEIAALAHVPGKEMAKTVIVKIRDELAMMVLPASYNVDFTRLSHAIGTGDVYLASESEFKDKFPDCEVGAMPPFGNLFEMDVFVAQSLSEDEEIFFNAGSHTELVKMNYGDFERLVQPQVISFTTRLPSEIYEYTPGEGEAGKAKEQDSP
jgi:Ala-tRNA(Pro) deacylase